MTAFFPVKTLQSITVTANPTAPTCLVGGTANVALTVVANYLEGTVESTEAVTLFTTSTNWANGVFTPATTVAGTENIVVSYTFEGTTKTFDVPVTVTAEAPKVTTVTVTLPTTIVEASSTQAVVLVKDQFGATMTTGFTTTYATTTGTSTVSNTGLVTAGSYSTTVANNAHVLTVTVTPTTGTAVSATANFTVTADTTKPTIVSVQAVDNKTIVVTYDKKVGTSATTVTNYSLYHSSTGVTAPLTDTAVSLKILASALFTDATQKIVKISLSTISNNDGKLSGYPADGLDAVNYRLYVSNVQDTTSNANTIIASSNVLFMGTTTPDSNKPVINAIAYNKGTGNLVITCDKSINNALVYSNIKFNGTALTSAITLNTPATTNKLDVTLASADKATIAALTGDITVTILADAVSDANGNKNVETSLLASITVPPTMTGATYDESTNTLTMYFSQTLDLSTSTLRAYFTDNASFKMKSTEFTAVALNTDDTLLTTSNNATVQVLLSTTHANAFEAVTTHTSPKVIVANACFKNTNGDSNIKQDDSTTDYPAPAMTVVKDTTKPAVTSVTYDETTKKLVFNFNTAVSRTFTNANVLFFYNNNTNTKTAFPTVTSLTGINPIEVIDGTTLTFDLSVSGSPANLAADLKTAQQGGSLSTDPESYASFVTFAADTFTKSGSLLKNIAVTEKATATTIAYTDNVGPYLAANVIHDVDGSQTSVYVKDQVTIWFAFDEKVDSVSAQLTSNYKIWLMNGQTKQSALTVNTATMVDATTTKKAVKLITGTQTSGATYLLEVVGVKDLAGNAASTTDATKYSKTFTGSGSTAPKPYPVSAKIKDNGNQSLDTSDYIAVTFDRPVKINTAAVAAQVIGGATGTNKSNFALTQSAGSTVAFPADYSPTANLMMSTDAADAEKVVWIKVDTTMVPSGNKPLIVGADQIDFAGTGDGTYTLIQDKYSDAYAKANGTPVVIQSGLGATTITEALVTDVDNSGTINKGDTLKVTFSNPMLVVSGTMAVTNVVTSSGRSFGTGATISTTMTTTVSSNTLTITMGDSPTLLPTDIKAGETVNVTNDYLKDSWGIKVKNTVTKAITTSPANVAPYITKAEWVNIAGTGTAAAGDFLYLTFNVPVYLKSDGTTGNGAGAINCWKFAGTDFATTSKVTKVQSDAKVIRIEFVGSAPTLTPTVTTVEIGSALASLVTNVSGVVAVTATTAGATTQKVVVPSDTAAPTITSAEFISDNKLKVVFSKAVNVTNYRLNDGTAGLNINGSTGLEATAVVLDSTDATGKTAIFTLEASVSIAQQSNGIAASATTGLCVSPSGTPSNSNANGITDLAGNALAGMPAGTSYIAISKDVTAPDAAVLAYDPTAHTGYELGTLKDQLIHINSGSGLIKENGTSALGLGEAAILQVYFGASAPSTDATAAGVMSSYVSQITSGATVITGLASATGGNKIYYRLVDRAGNMSAWVTATATVAAALPDGTYTLAATLGGVTEAGEAFYDAATKALKVYNASGNISYDLTNNATLQSVCAALESNDTPANADRFTMASGLVSAIDDSVAVAGAANSIALTAADCAATLTVKGDTTVPATNKVTLTGTANTVVMTQGEYDITGLAATTNNVTAAAAIKVTATGKDLAAVSGAFVITVNGAANVTVNGNITELALPAAISTKLTISSGTVTNVTGAGTVAALDMNGGTLTAYAAGLITNFALNGGTVTTIDKTKMTNLALGATAGTATITGGTGAWALTATGATASASTGTGKVTLGGVAPAVTLTAAAAGSDTITFTGNNASVVATASGAVDVTGLVITRL